MRRLGAAKGTGRGYRNLRGFPKDPLVHKQSRLGIKQPQSSAFSGFFMARKSLKTQANVDLTRYGGKWYQIAAKPAWFQSDCENVTAQYTIRPNNTVSVINTCRKDGKTEIARGIATKTEKDGTLKVSFESVPFISSNYNILYTDYETALVGSDDRKFLWILSRRPTIAKAKYAQLLARAKAQEYDVSDIKR